MKRTFFIFLSLHAFLFSLHAQNRRRIDSLLSLLSACRTDTTRVDLCNNICFEFQKINPDSALLFVNRALDLGKKIGFQKGIGAAIHNSGNIFYFKGEFSKALGFYQDALALREKIGDKKDIARTTGTIGNVHFSQGNYDKALVYYQKMLELGRSISDSATIADAQGNIANVYYGQGHYDRSLEFNLLSLRTRELLNDVAGMEHSYNNIAGIFFSQHNDIKALEYIKRSLALQQNAGNKKGMADSYENIGNIYYHLDSMDRAFDYFNRSLRITEELGNKAGIANAYDNLGSIYRQNKQYAKALELHKKSLAICEEIGDQKGMANALGNLGDDYMMTNDFADAKQCIARSLDIGRKTGAKYYIKNAYDYYVKLYKRLNDPKKALEYYELSSAIGDSLLNEANTRSIAEMQTRFDTEKKEKEISLLQKNKSLQDLELAEKEASNNRMAIITWCMLGLLLFIGAFVFFVVRSTNGKRKLNAALERKNEELLHQKEIVEQKNMLITDSIDYAQTLLHTREPSPGLLDKFFARHSILENASETVNGIAWSAAEENDGIFLMMVDSRTPGIPGSFIALQTMNRISTSLHAKDLQEQNKVSRFLNNMDAGVDAFVAHYNPVTRQFIFFSKGITCLLQGKNTGPWGKLVLNPGDQCLVCTEEFKRCLEERNITGQTFFHLLDTFKKENALQDDLLAVTFEA